MRGGGWTVGRKPRHAIDVSWHPAREERHLEPICRSARSDSAPPRSLLSKIGT